MKGFEWLIAKPEKRNYGSLSIIISFIFAIISLVFIIFGNNRIVAFYIGVSLISLLISFLVINKWIFSRLVNIAIIVALLIIACVTAYFMVPLIDREYDWSRNIEIEKKLALAQHQEIYGENKNALSTYESILEISARNIPALYGKVNILRRLNEREKMMSTYKAIIDKNPDLNYIIYEHAMAGWNTTDPQTKLDIFNKLIEEDDTNANYLEGRAKVYNELEKHEEALSDFEKALKYSEDDRTIATLYNQIGDTYLKMKNQTSAIENYNNAIDNHNSFVHNYTKIALLFYEAKEYKYAEPYFLNAIKVAKQNNSTSDLYIMRAKNFLAQNDKESALNNFNLAVREEETATDDNLYRLINALKERAIYFYDNKEYSDAKKDCSEIIRLCDPKPDKHSYNMYSAYFYSGNIFLEEENFEAAISEFNKAINLSPAYARPLHERRAVAYTKKGDYKKALSDFDTAIDGHPLKDTYNSYYERAVLHLIMGNLDDALSDINKAIDHKVYIVFLLLRAEIYDKMDNYTEAFNDAEIVFNYYKNNLDSENSEDKENKDKAAAIMSRK